MLLVGMLFLFKPVQGSGQDLSIQRSHALNPTAQSNVPTTGTLNLIAIMVEFQPDSNRLTSGTGIFGPGGIPYLERNPVNIDALPHNQSYFEAHLEFAKNYFERASDNQLSINYQVLPEVYRLDKPMQAYSPTGESFTNEKLAQLARDAWAAVEANGGFDATGLDPEETGFILFHAGVGRDIELVGTTLDITPQDIPSIYLGNEDLGNLLNVSGFDGFSMNGGTFRVTNTMILPRTESRRGLDIQDTEFVLPLSINGILTASIGSHLGLPDLFDPETGESGIGRFGLMDGAGIFAYNGLFPPEPSAWEKQALGWVNPFGIETATVDSVFLPAASLNNPDPIARYSLSNKEYFLVENRHRDPENDGVEVTIQRPDGSITTQRFENSDEVFVFQQSGFDELFEPGVLINVDNFDWALPGGYDIGADETPGTSDDRNLNGGVLIWHIDESVILNQRGGVNANEYDRGIDLEEADGSQDIGRPLEGLLDNSASFGSPFDFWWSGNDFRVVGLGVETTLYQNEFSPVSTPDNASNSGAASSFRFYDFSDNQSLAYFRLEEIPVAGAPQKVLDENLGITDTFGIENFGPNLQALSIAGNNGDLILPYADGLLIYDPLNGLVFDTSGFSARQPLILNDQRIFSHFYTDAGETNIIPLQRSGADWIAEPGITVTTPGGFLSSQTGDTLTLDGTTVAFSTTPFDLFPNYYLQPVQYSKRIGASLGILNNNEIEIRTPGGVLQDGHDYPQITSAYIGNLELEDGRQGFFIYDRFRIFVVDPESSDPFRLIYRSLGMDWPAIADWDRDGSLDFIFKEIVYEQLLAVNINGAVLNGFPRKAPNNEWFSGTPLIADIDDDGELNLLMASLNDFRINVRIFDQQMTELDYSPLFAGGLTQIGAPPLNPAFIGDILYTLSHDGELRGWHFPDLNRPLWIQKYGPAPYNKVVGELDGFSINPQPDYQVLNQKETYNWPNPANDETFIRFQVQEPGAKVDITIVNLNGQTIYRNTLQSAGGTIEELRIDTSNLGSGGYYALVKATVNGRTESKLIKIAVVH